MTEYTTLRLNQIYAGGGTQMRAVLNDETVQDYMEVFDAAGDWGPFPPIVVYYDGAQHWLADGFHRVAALRKWCHPTDPMETRTLVQADVRAGTRRDAILFAAGANASHGLRRTNADKRRAVETMLRDNEWCQWSNREIARRCNVDESTVRDLRLKLEATAGIPQSTDRTGADGRTINTANIGRRPEPEASVYESVVVSPDVITPVVRKALHRPQDVAEFLAQSKSWTDVSAMSAEAVAAELQQYLDDGWERWPAVMGYGWEVMVHPERKLATAEHYGSPSLLRVMRQGKYSAEGYAALVESLAVGDDLVMDEPSVTEVSPVDKNELFTEVDAAEEKADNWVNVVEVEIVDRKKGNLVVDPEDFEYIADEDEAVVPVSQRDGYDGDEWYTPLWLVKLVRDVMGGIDLDPASCEMAQTVVHADGYLTRFDDGLQYRWEGRVFINPPYSMPAAFIAKLQEEVKARRTTEAVVLVNNATETSWFQTMLGQWTVCFLNRRLAFWRHDHADVGARQGQAVFYFGPNVQRFEQVFAPHGTILRRVGVNSYEPV